MIKLDDIVTIKPNFKYYEDWKGLKCRVICLEYTKSCGYTEINITLLDPDSDCAYDGFKLDELAPIIRESDETSN